MVVIIEPIEATLAEMDQVGVSIGMLCAWHGLSGPMISNDEVAHYCHAHPGRFVGIAFDILFTGARRSAGGARSKVRHAGPAKQRRGRDHLKQYASYAPISGHPC
jgi:hypothetical protein